MAPLPPPTITFLHPDLGLGGAERLVIDAAISLQQLHCNVELITAHYDPNRCFPETLTDLKSHIHVGGSTIPRHFRGRFHLIFSILRTCIAAITHGKILIHSDAIIIDQVSYVIPIVKCLLILHPDIIPIIFYCHFPDYLLAPPRTSLLKRLYRYPLDAIEQWTTGLADSLIVNSKFTASVFREAFPKLNHVDLKILYPPCDVGTTLLQQSPTRGGHGNNDENKNYIQDIATRAFINRNNQDKHKLIQTMISGNFLLSLNRFERKKGLNLAIEALGIILHSTTTTTTDNDKLILILAGGYDVRVIENVQHLQELQQLVMELKLQNHVIFVPSCSQEEKIIMLNRTRCLLYTPQREHFGIVPLEAGAAGRPVIACNSGGPKETVLDGSTGYLVDPTPEAFAEAALQFLGKNGDLKSQEFGERARQHIQMNFSRETFGQKLLEICTVSIQNLQQQQRNQLSFRSSYYRQIFVMVFIFSIVLYFIMYERIIKVVVEEEK
jgi:alpha-1,3/alpha-1,6-mannosyltransferase